MLNANGHYQPCSTDKSDFEAREVMRWRSCQRHIAEFGFAKPHSARQSTFQLVAAVLPSLSRHADISSISHVLCSSWTSLPSATSYLGFPLRSRPLRLRDSARLSQCKSRSSESLAHVHLHHNPVVSSSSSSHASVSIRTSASFGC